MKLRLGGGGVEPTALIIVSYIEHLDRPTHPLFSYHTLFSGFLKAASQRCFIGRQFFLAG